MAILWSKQITLRVWNPLYCDVARFDIIRAFNSTCMFKISDFFRFVEQHLWKSSAELPLQAGSLQKEAKVEAKKTVRGWWQLETITVVILDEATYHAERK